MRTSKCTWAVINKVLDGFGQSIVTHVEHGTEGIKVGFNKKGTKIRKEVTKP